MRLFELSSILVDVERIKEISVLASVRLYAKFKTKHATELKTGKQEYFQYIFYAIKVKTEKTVYFVILFYDVKCSLRIGEAM